MAKTVKLSGEYYGTAEAARKLRRTESRVRQMVRGGELDAVQVSPRVWLVPARAVHKILRDRESVA